MKARDARLSAVSTDLSAAREAETQARQQVAELNTAVAAAAAELAQQKQELGTAAQQYEMLLARVTALEPFRAALVDQVRAAIGDQPGVVLTPDSIVLESDGMFNQRRSVITLTDEGEARLRAVAEALAGVVSQIPADFPWVLRVEGHTDDLQLKPGSAFRTNWQLAAERATVVTEFLRASGCRATA